MSEVGDAVQVVMLCGRGAMLIGNISLKLAMQFVKLLNTIYLAKWEGSVSLNRLRQIKGDDFVFINVSSEQKEDLAVIEKEMKSHGILYARMPDLCGGDARTQYAIASSDAVKMKAMLLDHTAGPNRHIRVGPISEADYMMTGKKADGTDTKEMEALKKSAQETIDAASKKAPKKAEAASLWMLPGYLDGISQAGGIPIVFPFTTDEQELRQLMRMCDGFLFTGGHDVSPMVYNEEPLEDLIDCCEKRDRMETIVLKEAISDDKPVLGICRGIQFINAVLGGKLYQDLPTQHPSEVNHHQTLPYDVPTHNVAIVADSPLHKCLEVEQLPVNSYHHQAVRIIAPGLIVMAAAADGIVEAIYKPDNRFLWAVQWHPEFSYRTDANSMKIFRAFVDAMMKAMMK